MPAEFELQTHTRGRGKVGEDAAVRWLEGEGYLVLERNVVTHAGEIDVVARDGEWLVFLEIKARGSAAYGPAIAAVGPAKQRRISRAAALYLAIRRDADHPGFPEFCKRTPTTRREPAARIVPWPSTVRPPFRHSRRRRTVG